MIKLTAGFSKKLPVDGVEYSSRSYSAHIEIEVADQVSDQGVQDRLDILYRILEGTVEKKLNEDAPRQPMPPKGNGNGRKNGSGAATEAQQRAIFAISKDLGIEAVVLKNMIEEQFDVSDPAQLSRKDASRLIDQLKSLQSAPAGT